MREDEMAGWQPDKAETAQKRGQGWATFAAPLPGSLRDLGWNSSSAPTPGPFFAGALICRFLQGPLQAILLCLGGGDGCGGYTPSLFQSKQP